MTFQQGWASCPKCQGLHYAGFPQLSTGKGVCPAGGLHQQTGSFAYEVEFEVAERPNLQHGWASCSKCQGLHFAGFPDFKGVCPAGGQHEQHGSFAYALPFDLPPSAEVQQEWAACPKCQGFFFGPFEGVCPAGGKHSRENSFSYQAPCAGLSNFTFDSAISDVDRTRLIDSHRMGFNALGGGGCRRLNDDHKAALSSTYRKAISHGFNTNPKDNASAVRDGTNIDINFTNWSPLNDDERAQTLIHELMHCAGFSHPTRRDPSPPGAPCDSTVNDCPGDNGPYYGSPPLLAELCIGAAQSDMVCAPARDLKSYVYTRYAPPEG